MNTQNSINLQIIKKQSRIERLLKISPRSEMIFKHTLTKLRSEIENLRQAL